MVELVADTRHALRRRALILVAIPLTAFILMGASCSTSQFPPDDGSGRPSIAFLGDSLFWQATDTINAHYGTDYQVTIDALLGATNDVMRPEAAKVAATNPDIVVIDLMANDAHKSPAAFDAAAVEAAMQYNNDSFPNSCVIWMTGSTDHSPTWDPDQEAVLVQYAKDHFAHIADWGAAWQLAYYDDPAGPHPNQLGREAEMSVIDQAIAGCDATTTSTSEDPTTSLPEDTTTIAG